MKAILPAAGYATRMYPLTLIQPKALLPIHNTTALDNIIKKISKLKEIDKIYIITNNKFYNKFLDWYNTNHKYNSNHRIKIKIINDLTNTNEERLGTIGDINFILEKEKIDDDFLIINSDNLFSFNLEPMLKSFKRKNSTTIGVFDVKDIKIAKKIGTVKLDQNKKIIYFVEKDPNTKTTLCSIGIYFFPKKTKEMIKIYIDERNYPDKTGDFIRWLSDKKDVHGHIFTEKEGYWFDIGSMETYKKANKTLKNIYKE